MCVNQVGGCCRCACAPTLSPKLLAGPLSKALVIHLHSPRCHFLCAREVGREFQTWFICLALSTKRKKKNPWWLDFLRYSPMKLDIRQPRKWRGVRKSDAPVHELLLTWNTPPSHHMLQSNIPTSWTRSDLSFGRHKKTKKNPKKKQIPANVSKITCTGTKYHISRFSFYSLCYRFQMSGNELATFHPF